LLISYYEIPEVVEYGVWYSGGEVSRCKSIGWEERSQEGVKYTHCCEGEARD